MKRGTTMAIFVAALGMSCTVQAGMKLTIRTEIKMGGMQVAGQDRATMQQMMSAVLPTGPVETVMYLEKESSRTEMHSNGGMLPNGTITIHRGGEAVTYVINPNDRTYYAVQGGQMMSGEAGHRANVTVTPTNETETIAGHQARKVLITFTPADAAAAGAQVTLEVWSTSDFGNVGEASQMMLAEALRSAGVSLDERARQLVQFPMRTKFQYSMGPISAEMTSNVTAVEQMAVPESMFAAPPPGYRKVDNPLGGLFQMIGKPPE